MAQIQITYTPQTSSDSMSPAMCHRICYREVGGTDYCCLTDDTASEAGTPKTFLITVGEVPCDTVPVVDPETCLTTGYEGYVQACCEDESSLDGRVAWSALFQPDPSCINKLVCCIAQRPLSQSTSVILNQGSGYDDALSPLTVTIVRDPEDSVTPGGANDATAAVTLSGGVVVGFSITSPGLYSKIPTFVVPAPTLGGPSQAYVTLILYCSSSDLPTPGTVYVPDTYQGNCIDSPMGVTSVDLLLGQCANMCFPKDYPYIYDNDILSGDPNITSYSYTLGTGCCDCTTCRNYTVITNSQLTTITLAYTKCTDNAGNNAEPLLISSPGVPGSGSYEIECAVPGSIYCVDDPNCIVSIVDTGVSPCCVPS